MKIISILRWLAVIAVIALIAFIAAKWSSAPEASNFKMQQALVTDLKSAMELCTVEIIEDVPIKGHIGSKHIFARATINGQISFNLDSIHTTMKGDTIIVSLPPERVEVSESTAPGSYEVIDTWNEKLLASSKFSTEEENRIKRIVADNFRKKIYAKGYVRQARLDALETLGAMLPALTTSPVRIIDPSPAGYPGK